MWDLSHSLVFSKLTDLLGLDFGYFSRSPGSGGSWTEDEKGCEQEGIESHGQRKSDIALDAVLDQIALHPVWTNWIKFSPGRETSLAQRSIKDRLDTEQEREAIHPLKRAPCLFGLAPPPRRNLSLTRRS